MFIPIRKQVQSFVMRITGVPFASSLGENKAKGFSQSPTVKSACIKEISDEKYSMNKWLAKPDAYGMNVVLPLVVSDVPDTLASVYAIGGMLTGALLMLLITRMAKRLTDADKISISEHDAIREKLELSMKESAEAEISKLMNTKYKLQSSREEISKLMTCHKNFRKEIIELKWSIVLQMQSSKAEIRRLEHINQSAQKEISEMKNSHYLQNMSAQTEICIVKNNHLQQMLNVLREMHDLKHSQLQMLKLQGKTRKVLDCTNGEIRDV